MKGLQSLFLGIFGIFAFSWLGMTVVPNLQIGALNPQTDEDGGDVYPSPISGMARRGAQVYAANGCVYCHSQQVRPDYGGSDIERKWGQRRSAPRDYLFEPVVLLGKMRTGPDLANVGHREALQEKGAASPPPATSAASPAAPTASPAPAIAGAGTPAAGPPLAASPVPAVAVAGASPAASPSLGASPPAASPAAAATAATGAAPEASPSLGTSPASGASPAAAGIAAASPTPSPVPAADSQPAATVPTTAPAMVANVNGLTADGRPLPYTAAWHHRHLYSPRSISEDSNMPAYRFLYEKRRISGIVSPDAINFAGDNDENPQTGWEIVPSYDAKCLVAYLMSRDQSHELKEAKSPIIAAAPGKEAQK